MVTGRIVKASNYGYCKMVDVPDEIMEFFDTLSDNYGEFRFIVDVDPDTYEDGTEASLEVMIYDADIE